MRRTNSSSKLKEDSISKQFAASLKKLYATLDDTEPHYVRCIKPNENKSPGSFMAHLVLQQLQYAGMIETIRIRQQGYSLRMLHTDFFARYCCLDPQCSTLVELVGSLSGGLGVGAESWQLGTTRIYVRRDMGDKLDRLLWVRMSSSARIVQKGWRLVLAWRLAVHLQRLLRGRRCRRAYLASRRAAVLAQSLVRRKSALGHYRRVRQSCVRVQTLARGWLAKALYRKLRNPYSRLGYSELTLIIEQNNDKLRALMVLHVPPR